MLKKTAIWLKTFAGPSVSSSANTGTSHSASQIAETRSERATVGRTWSGNSSPSRLSTRLVSWSLPLPWPPCTWKACTPSQPPMKPISAGAEHDDRERQRPKKKIATKASAASATITLFFKRALADAHDRFQHDREHRRLQPEEQRRDDPDLAVGGIDVAQRHDGDDAGQDEQHAGHQAAERAVHQPADIGRELLRLRPRQQHAVVERVQEPALGDPALLLDQDAMHHRDLPGRAAEAQQRDAQPDAERLARA